MTEKEVKIQQKRNEKFNKLKRELTPYKDMIKSIDNLSESSERIIIGISKKEGRGELKTSRVLKGVFTEEIGEQLRSELLECYEIR